MTKTIQEVINQGKVLRSSKPPTAPSTARTLPGRFVEQFKTDGPGWNEAERLEARAWKLAAQEFAADMKEGLPGWSLAFLGMTSVGKTYLGRALFRFASNLHLVRPARYGGQEPPPGPAQIFWPDHTWDEVSALQGATFLLIDEVGRGDRNGREWLRFMNLLSYRLQRNLFTVITSNLTFRELKAIDPAIASRLRRNGGRAFQAGAGIRPFEDRRIESCQTPESP